MNYIKSFYRFLRDIYKNKTLLLNLTKNDFKSRYMGNYLGIMWAFVQPAITIVIFWFVFQVGFKSKPVENFPFILWLMAGMVPWFFFADSLQSGMQSILANSFLVKKVVFRVSLLPIVQIISALVIHVFFIVVMLGMYLAYGFEPNVYWLQIFYYLFCSIVLLLGLAWFNSAVVVFFKDLGQIITVFIQFGFWLTPIFWTLKMVPVQYQWLFKINPAYYITQGYRDALISHVWFWDKPKETLLYWTITIIVVVSGAVVFRKLRPHFADVL